MTDKRSADEQQKLLLEIIKRFDGYINATNSKIAVVLSYCMAYIGGLGFKLVDLSDKRIHDCAWWVLLGVLLVSVLATLVAAGFAYRALKPQTPAGRALHEKPSVIFLATWPRMRAGAMANGPEFVSKALDAWAHAHGVRLQFIRPGKPVENAHIESFNDRLRDECLNQHAFVSLDDARARIEAWRADYNSLRPHSALGQLAPDQFRQLHQPKTGEPTNLRMVYSAG